MKHKLFKLGIISVLLCVLLGSQGARACQVLVVMSYYEEMPRVIEITKGIDSVLGEMCELHYRYLDLRRHPENMQDNVQQAYSLYQELQPDGVIAVDNEAQSLFVLPYLKDKVDTPVVFCGVNANAEGYGYPASNVTGVIEQIHITESLVFVRQLVPSVNTVGILMRDDLKAQDIFRQIEDEAESHPVRILKARFVKTVDAALTAAEELKHHCDALFLASLNGLLDKQGKPIPGEQVIPLINQVFAKPLIVPNSNALQAGALCAVVEIVQEQGMIAATMLQKILQGTPLSALPIRTNQKGQRMLNVTVLKNLGVMPRPHVLQGVKLVETVKE